MKRSRLKGSRAGPGSAVTEVAGVGTQILAVDNDIVPELFGDGKILEPGSSEKQAH